MGEEHIGELLHHVHGIYRIKIVCVGVEETAERRRELRLQKNVFGVLEMEIS